MSAIEYKRSYYTRGDGKEAGYITLGEAANGNRADRKVVYGKNRNEVKKKLDSIEYLLRTGQYFTQSKDTLVSFLYEYHDVCSSKWAETTAELYKMYIVTHIEPYFKNMKLKDVKTIALDKFYNSKLNEERTIKILKKGKSIDKVIPPLSVNTVNKLNKFLKAAFNYAIINDIIVKNPTVGVKLSSPVKYKPNVYNEEQFKSLINQIKGKEEEIPIILAAGCGFRRGEICGLTWNNIDFDKKTIEIVKTSVRFNKTLEKEPKNETSKRKISAPGYVINALYKFYIDNGKPVGKVITRWKPQSLTEMFNNLLDTHGMSHTRLHDLRHYNAVIMMQYGIPDKVAAERLGHSNVTTLRQIYQHVLNGMDTEAASKIDDALKKM